MKGMGATFLILLNGVLYMALLKKWAIGQYWRIEGLPNQRKFSKKLLIFTEKMLIYVIAGSKKNISKESDGLIKRNYYPLLAVTLSIYIAVWPPVVDATEYTKANREGIIKVKHVIRQMSNIRETTNFIMPIEAKNYTYRLNEIILKTQKPTNHKEAEKYKYKVEYKYSRFLCFDML